MILVLGYYDKSNLGDEQYKTSLLNLLRKNGVRGTVEFVNPHMISEIPPDTSLVICGGGNIIDSWFWSKIKTLILGYRGPVIALSVGLSWESTITDEYLDKYNMVVLRHSTWMDRVADVVGMDRVMCIPDIGLNLDPQPAMKFERPRIGVFWVNGIEIEGLREALEPYLETHDIVTYCMNVSTEEHEGDRFANMRLRFNEASPDMSWETLMSHIGGLDLAICARFHANIFSIVQHTPFVCYASTTKTKFLMDENNFHENVATDFESLRTAIDWSLRNRDTLIEKIRSVHQDARYVLSNFRVPCLLPTLESIEAECTDLEEDGATPEEIARTALVRAIGSSDNKYLWGFTENIRAGNHSLIDMIKWVWEDYKPPKRRGLRFLQTPDDFSGVHRSGWEAVTRTLRQLEMPDGILCDLSLDATFTWRCEELLTKGVIPYKQMWIGFIHHTYLEDYSPNNVAVMFRNPAFITSLKTCKTLIVLSKYLAEKVRESLDQLHINVPVEVVFHPTEAVFSGKFNIRSWLDKPTLTQVGAWLRNPYTIYALKLPWGHKQVLEGPKMENYVHPQQWHVANTLVKCACVCADGQVTDTSTTSRSHDSIMTRYMTLYIKSELGAPSFAQVRAGAPCCSAVTMWSTSWSRRMKLIEARLLRNYASVTKLRMLSNHEYDILLSRTVVFLDLLDCSAANTIIECAMRDTPVVVNPHPAVREYLGADYPAYWYDTSQIWRAFNPSIMYKANQYLANMSKTDLTFDVFVQKIERILQN